MNYIYFNISYSSCQNQGSSTLTLLTFWAGEFLVVKVIPRIVKCLVESFVSGLCPLDARSTASLKSPCSSFRIVTTKNVSRHRQMSPGRQVYSQLRTIVLDNELHKNKCRINLPSSCLAVLLTLTASTTKALLKFLTKIYHNHLESFKEIQGPRINLYSIESKPLDQGQGM